MENLASVDSAKLREIAQKYSPYLAEIRKRILLTVSVWGIATIFGFVFYEKIIRFLIGKLSLSGVNIVFTSPFQFVNLAITCGIATGLVIVFPIITFQLMSFLRPALKKKEYRMVMTLIPFSMVLFAIGFLFGTVVMKWQIQIFLERAVSLGIGNFLDISKLLSDVLLTSTLMGVGFQFPIVLLILLRLGIIKHHTIAKLRLWVYLGSLLFAILLPLDSIIIDILLSLPLIILFEGTLLLNRILGTKKKG